MIDIHAHIIPGVDDGPRSLDGSLEIARKLVETDVTDVIATPHYVHETNYVSPRVNNLRLLAELRQFLASNGVKINLYLGNEIYIDRNIIGLLKAKKISTLAGSDYLLVELPLDQEFPDYQDILGELVSQGYKVILAHPERYIIVQDNYDVLLELHEMGVLFQCNLRSILGRYGGGAKKMAQRLAKDRLIFTFGSDIHHGGNNNDLALAQKKLRKYYSEHELTRVLVTNPGSILRASKNR